MKSKYNLFQVILLAFIIPFTFTACDDDDKAVPESQVSWTLSLPEDIENPTLSDLKVTITNINTNTQYDGSVSMNEQTVTVTATVRKVYTELLQREKSATRSVVSRLRQLPISVLIRNR